MFVCMTKVAPLNIFSLHCALNHNIPQFTARKVWCCQYFCVGRSNDGWFHHIPLELLYEEGTELCYRVAGIIDTFANSENKLLRK